MPATEKQKNQAGTLDTKTVVYGAKQMETILSKSFPNTEPASLVGCIKTACGDFIRTIPGFPKFLPNREVDTFGLKHLSSSGLSQVPTRQTLSQNIPHKTKIALFEQEIENQKQHLAMKSNYIDFREEHFKNEHKIKNEELLRTIDELSESKGDKEKIKKVLVEEQKISSQLQEDERKQQAVVEELIRKDLWNREQKLLREAENKKKPNVIQHLRKQEEKSVILIAHQDLQEQQHLGQPLLRKQKFIEEQQITAPLSCQGDVVVAGSPGPAHCRLVEKLVAWGQLPGLSSSDCSRLVMKLRAERGGLTGLAMGEIEGEVGRLAREEEEDIGGVLGMGE